MLSGIIFILVAWLVPELYEAHLWLSICLTIWGSLCILGSMLKWLLRFISAASEDY